MWAIPSIKDAGSKAKQIIQHVHKLIDVLGYTESQWAAYEGVGKELAARIIEEISQL